MNHGQSAPDAASVSQRLRGQVQPVYRNGPVLGDQALLYTGVFTVMQNKYPIGILGATGMVGQRFIQLLENHPWFEITWIAASDRSSGKIYGEAAKWRLDTPLPERIAQHDRFAGRAREAPRRSSFSSSMQPIARELEPKFAAAGCAVVSNSSAFRMAPNVPLVLPEVNAEHLHLIEEQSWRQRIGRLHCHQLQLHGDGPGAGSQAARRIALASSRSSPPRCRPSVARAIPALPSMDILDNVIPYISSEEEKMEEEMLKLLGKLDGNTVKPLAARMSASCNRVPVVDGHTVSVSVKLARRRLAKRSSPHGRSFARWQVRTCRARPISPSNVRRSRTARSLASTAIAAKAWRRPSAACGPAECSTGSSPCSRTTRFAEPPAPPF